MLASAFLSLVLGLPSQQAKVLDAMDYRTTAAARAVWRPVESSPEVLVSVEPVEGKKGVRFPCDFDRPSSRVYWDRNVQADLSTTDRIEVDLYVPDITKAGGAFHLYFQSGGGWYGAGFPAGNGWNRVRLPKNQFQKEGEPEGWDKIDRIRFALWRGTEQPTWFQLGGISAVASPIAIFESRDASGEPSAQAEAIRRLLDLAGFECGVVPQSALTQRVLDGRSLAVFPENPKFEPDEWQALQNYLGNGGKVMACFSVSQQLFPALGLAETRYIRPEAEGQFSSIRLSGEGLLGQPRFVLQKSWNIMASKTVPGDGRVVANWHDQPGRNTGYPAIVVSKNGAYISHILTEEDLPQKIELLRSIVGHLQPRLLAGISDRIRADMDKIGGFGSLSDLKSALRRSGREKAVALLKEAEKALSRADDARKAGRFSSEIGEATVALDTLSKAFCASLQPKEAEIRAAWCHDAAGVPGMTWDQVLAEMKKHQFTAVFPNMLWGGLAYYPSKVLPVDPSVAQQGDRIAECVAAGKKYGIEVHVWKVNFNLMNAPKPFLEQMRNDGRTQVSASGESLAWLCPSHPLNQKLELDSMVEVVRKYAVDGIHFDYIRYPGKEGCYCSGCRSRFEADLGKKVDEWPSDVVNGELVKEYEAFRRAQITKLVREVSTEVRKARPGVKVSAAVFRDWPTCRDTVGQDWGAWVRDGYLDIVCPMSYTPIPSQFEAWTRSHRPVVPKGVKLLPGVGVTLEDWTLRSDEAALQIQSARKAGADGLILFNLSDNLIRRTIPDLALSFGR